MVGEGAGRGMRWDLHAFGLVGHLQHIPALFHHIPVLAIAVIIVAKGGMHY